MASRNFAKVFPEIYRSTYPRVRAPGRLDGVLERLADYTENREVTRQKVLGPMLYPIVLSIICLGIVTGMMVYVVPKVIEVFESSKGKLPFADPGADRRQRFPAQLGHLSRACDRCRHCVVRLLAQESRQPAPLSPLPAQAAALQDGWCAVSIPRASRARSASSRPAPCRCSKPCASRAKW
jgi:hypothetical protein